MMNIDLTDRLTLRLEVGRGLGFGFGLTQFSGPGTVIEAGVAVGPFSVQVEVWPPQAASVGGDNDD